MPFFSVSLALSGPDLNPLLGLVFDPLHNEMFKGLRGRGGTQRAAHSRHQESALERAMLVTGFPYDRWTNRTTITTSSGTSCGARRRSAAWGRRRSTCAM